jgi:hypothetical protein
VVTKRIEGLQKELARKLAEMIEEDNVKLRKKSDEIEKLQQQLKNEERRCAEIKEEMAYDQQCEAQILQEEETLNEKNRGSPHRHLMLHAFQ